MVYFLLCIPKYTDGRLRTARRSTRSGHVDAAYLLLSCALLSTVTTGWQLVARRRQGGGEQEKYFFQGYIPNVRMMSAAAVPLGLSVLGGNGSNSIS